MFKQLIARPAVYLVILLASIGVENTASRASVPPPPSPLSATDLLATATLDTQGVWRGIARETPEILHLELPAAGIATIEARAPRVDFNSIRLDIHPLGRLSGATILEQSASRLVLAARQGGDLWLRVGTREPGSFHVITRFAPARVLEEDFVLQAEAGIAPLKARRTSFFAIGRDQEPLKTEPEVIDPDPDTLGSGGESVLARFWRLDTSAPSPKTEPEVIDPDPDTAMAGAPEIDHVIRFRTPCLDAHRRDDHGDIPSCATPLRFGERITGTVDGGLGDDTDIFALTLTETATVEVHLGEIGKAIPAVVADLDDCAGRRLAADPGELAAGPLDGPLIATLGPGRYCVRVEGDAIARSYALEVIARTFATSPQASAPTP